MDAQRRADVVALIRVALDLGTGHGEGRRLDRERRAQLPVCRAQFDRRLERLALFGVEGRRYLVLGGIGRDWDGRWAHWTGGVSLWQCANRADHKRHDEDRQGGDNPGDD